MALAAVVLVGGVTSCEPDQEEKANIMKQWTCEYSGMTLAFDFCTTTPDQIYYTMLEYGTENEETGKIELTAMPVGKILSVEETDATSGTIKVEAQGYDEETNMPITVQGEIPYKDLTVNSVSVDAGIVNGGQVTGQWLPLTVLRSSSKYVWVPMPGM